MYFFRHCIKCGAGSPVIIDREAFESTLEAGLGSADFSGLTSTSDLDKYADFIVTVISTAVDKAIPKSKVCDLRVTRFLMKL